MPCVFRPDTKQNKHSCKDNRMMHDFNDFNMTSVLIYEHAWIVLPSGDTTYGLTALLI